MWLRLVIASIGGTAITVAMLYGMSEIAELFTRRSPDLYYQVMDVIPGPPGPRRPERIQVDDAPERPRLEYVPEGSIVIDTRPEFRSDSTTTAPSPRLDTPATAPP